MNLLAMTMTEFLNGNIFGYLLHAFEVALSLTLFCFYLNRRRHFAVRYLSALVLFMGLSLGLGLLFERFLLYFRYLCVLPLALMLIPLCCKENIWNELFCCVAAIAMQNLAFSLSGIIVGMFGRNPVEFDSLFSFIQTVIYLVVQFGGFWVCAKMLRSMDSEFGKERIPMIFVSLLIALMVYVFQHDRQSLDSADFFWWRSAFIGFDIVTLFMLFGMYERSRLRKENAILDQLRVSEEQQYEFDKRAIEIVNIKCHDLKHQLIGLRAAVGEEQAQMLREVEDAVMIYDAVAKTGCKPLDVILANKYLLCEQYGIRFTYMIDGEKLAFMSAVDIYSLFGNALDNAIRAVKDASDDTKKVINMTVFAREKFLYIHVENYTEVVPSFKDGLPITTQPDTDRHGFGMMSMKRIAETYDGVMVTYCKGKIFNLELTLPIRYEAVTPDE